MDKFIIIGTKSFFNSLTNDEMVNAVGSYYNKNKNANEACLYLLDVIKNNRHKKNNNLIFNTDKTIKKDSERYSNDITFEIIFFE